MSVLRYLLSVLALLGLAAGYAASQYAFFNGQAPDYAQMADQAWVRLSALALLVAAIVLSFIPEREGVQP